METNLQIRNHNEVPQFSPTELPKIINCMTPYTATVRFLLLFTFAMLIQVFSSSFDCIFSQASKLINKHEDYFD